MNRQVLGLFDRHGAWIRIVLLLAAVTMLAWGWILGPMLVQADSYTWSRAAAAGPVTAWGLLDAVWDQLRRRNSRTAKSIHGDINIVLRELEDLAVAAGHSLRLSGCAVKVWEIRKRTLWDVAKREKRVPLAKVAESSLLMETHSSGLSWRLGMGVMGTALKDNNVLAVDVPEAWKDVLEDRSKELWDRLPEPSKFGLSYEQFLKLVRPKTMKPTGPFVLAVPYYQGSSPRGVVALDMDPEDAEAIKLGGEYDDYDGRVAQLMYALATASLSK